MGDKLESNYSERPFWVPAEVRTGLLHKDGGNLTGDVQELSGQPNGFDWRAGVTWETAPKYWFSDAPSPRFFQVRGDFGSRHGLFFDLNAKVALYRKSDEREDTRGLLFGVGLSSNPGGEFLGRLTFDFVEGRLNVGPLILLGGLGAAGVWQSSAEWRATEKIDLDNFCDTADIKAHSESHFTCHRENLLGVEARGYLGFELGISPDAFTEALWRRLVIGVEISGELSSISRGWNLGALLFLKYRYDRPQSSEVSLFSVYDNSYQNVPEEAWSLQPAPHTEKSGRHFKEKTELDISSIYRRNIINLGSGSSEGETFQPSLVDPLIFRYLKSGQEARQARFTDAQGRQRTFQLHVVTQYRDKDYEHKSYKYYLKLPLDFETGMYNVSLIGFKDGSTWPDQVLMSFKMDIQVRRP